MIGLGLGVGIARPLIAPASGPASNLLLWTEAMDNAVWVKAGIAVTPDAAALPVPPGDGSATADLIAWGSANKNLIQTSETVATSGAGASVGFDMTPGVWLRAIATATFDTGTFTASVYVNVVSGVSVLLKLDQAGGFLRAYLRSQVAPASAYVGAWQLEVGSSATAYVARTT